MTRGTGDRHITGVPGITTLGTVHIMAGDGMTRGTILTTDGAIRGITAGMTHGIMEATGTAGRTT